MGRGLGVEADQIRARLRQASRLFADRERALTQGDLTTLLPEDIRASRVFAN